MYKDFDKDKLKELIDLVYLAGGCIEAAPVIPMPVVSETDTYLLKNADQSIYTVTEVGNDVHIMLNKLGVPLRCALDKTNHSKKFKDALCCWGRYTGHVVFSSGTSFGETVWTNAD